jgi:hypothetical protein
MTFVSASAEGKKKGEKINYRPGCSRLTFGLVSEKKTLVKKKKSQKSEQTVQTEEFKEPFDASV